VEEMPSAFLGGSILECAERRLDASDILKLYGSANYPLARKTP